MLFHQRHRPSESRIMTWPAMLMLALCLPTLAYAGGHGAEHQPSILDLTRYWINFLAFVWILYALLKRPVPAAWRQRRLLLAQEVDQAQSDFKVARMRYEEAQNNLKNSAAHLIKLEQRVKEETAMEISELMADADRRATSIAAQAEQTIAAERRAAERALQTEIIDLALAQAEDRVRSELSVERDREVRRAALSGVDLLLQ